MGTEVASRPPLPPGFTLASNSQGPGKKKCERKISSSGSSRSNSSLARPIYARDYHLRIQGRKYSLSSAFVCIGAKIHTRYSPSQEEGRVRSFSQTQVDRNAQTVQIAAGLPDTRRGISPSKEDICDQNDAYGQTRTHDDRQPFHQTGAERLRQTRSLDDRFRFASPCDDGSRVFQPQDERNRLYTYIQDPSLTQENRFGYITAQDINKHYQTQHLRRGISRVTLDEHPTSTLEIVDQLPQEFSHKIKAAINSFRTPSSSNRSSPTITESEGIPSSSPSIVQEDLWGTGNTTERSSVDSQYSWDEFDRQAAKTVQNLFDEIDSVLFERRPNQAEYIYNECQEWGSQFPHLRILGRQLLQEQESGYEMIERDPSRPNTTSSMGLLDITDQDLSGSQDSQGLSVSGRKMRAIIPPVEARSRNSGTPSTQSSEFSYLEEEVFDVEGEYEEIIAVDYKDIYEDHSDSKKQLTPRRRPAHYPPITPNACLKDGVASAAFDCIWQEIISWIRPLLKKYSIVVLDENKPLNPSLQSLSQTLRNESTPGPPSRENSQSQLRYPMGRAHTMIGLERPLDSPKLDGVLQIVRKIPIHRENSTLLGESSESQISVTQQARPVSSLPLGMKDFNKGRPGSTRLMQAGRGRNMRLAPITGYDRSKTPSVQDEERVPAHPASGALLVRKINPPGIGRLSSPPYNNPRNGAPLPPIGTPLELEPTARYQKKLVSSRASSAVDKDLRVAYKDRYLNSQDARPSTTHAFRSETPQGLGRRASTPFNNSVAFNPNSVSRNSNFGPAGMSLDIRGSGLQPSHDHLSHLGNIPQEILEDHEGLDEHIHPNQWTPSTPSHNNPYRRGRQISNLVRS